VPAGACAAPAGGRRGTGIEAVSDAKATLAEAKGSAVSHDQTVGCTPGVILPVLPGAGCSRGPGLCVLGGLAVTGQCHLDRPLPCPAYDLELDCAGAGGRQRVEQVIGDADRVACGPDDQVT
jgi:hypothetical protein